MVMLLLLALPLALAQNQAEPRAEKDVAKLAQTVEKGTPAERLQALRQLADLGPEAQAAVPALIKTLRDPDETLRLDAAPCRVGSDCWVLFRTRVASVHLPRL